MEHSITKKLASLATLFLLVCFAANVLRAQCPADPLDSSCFDEVSSDAYANYANVVIAEVSGDAGQSDACNDAIVEIAGPPGTNIGCMVLTDTEWAVLIPPGTLLPADGVYVIACATGSTNCGVGINGASNGLIADGTEGDFNPGLPIDLDVCDPANASFYDPAASGFTLDNAGNQGLNGDGEQVFMFLPDGTPWDGIVWDGGGSGNADHVSVSVNGNDYTLGDNDGNGVVNDNPGTVPGGRGDGGNATAVPVLPTNAACPCNTPDNPGTFTVPAIGGANDDNGNGGPLWTAWTTSDHVGCNSSFIRLDPGSSAGGFGGSPSHMDGQVDDATQSTCGNNTDAGSAEGMDGDFGESTITSEIFNPDPITGGGYTPSACGDASAEWAYTDHPTPGEPNDDPTFVFYVDNDVLCDPSGTVTFTVEVYNWQHVSDNTDTDSGIDNLQSGSLVNDPLIGLDQTWMTYSVSGETTTMTYTAGPFPAGGTYDFDLVWDDFTNCCGTSKNPGTQSNPNECYEVAHFSIKVAEELSYDCDGDGVADDPQTPCAISCDPAPPVPGAININDYITGGTGDLTFTLSDDAGINTDEINSSGVFLLPTDVDAGPYTVTIVDNGDCSFGSLSITIADNCELPPVCPSNLDNTGTTANGDVCPGDMVDLCLDGDDLPAGGTITWYATTDGSDPIIVDGAAPSATVGATAINIGSVAIPAVMTIVPSNTKPVVNEVLYNPAAADGTTGANGEFIEIAAVPGTDLSGYLVFDPDWSIILPAGTTVPASGFFVLGFSEAELPTGKSVSLNIDDIPADNIGGSPMTLTNGTELVGLSEPDGAGGFTFCTGVEWGGTDSDNVTPLGTAGGGGSYDFSAETFETSTSSEGNGESIGLIVDGDITSGYDESGDITDSAGENTGGCPNVMVPPAEVECISYTVPDLCSMSPATLTIEAIIEPIDPACTGADFNYVGATSSYTVDCPEASIMATTISGCSSDFPAGVMIPVTIIGGTGPYQIDWTIDGVAQAPTIISSGGNIVVPVPMMGKVNVTGVTDTSTGGCVGSVSDVEICVEVLDPPKATIMSATAATSCMPCDGTVTITFTNIPESGLEFEYTIDGNGPFAASASSSPYILMGACAGSYEIVSVEGTCVGTFSGTATVDPPVGTPAISITTQPEAICNDGSIEIDLTTVEMSPEYNQTTHSFFNVNPLTLPESAWSAAQLSNTTLSGITSNQTIWVLYQDIPAPPESGCVSVATINVTVDPDLCVFDLALTKAVNTGKTPPPYAPGDAVVYTICVFNQGLLTAANTQVMDYGSAEGDLINPTLPAPLCLFPTQSTQGTPLTITAMTNSVFSISNLEPGEDVCVDIQYTISDEPSGPSIINNAEITADSGDDIDSIPNDNTDDDPDPNDDSTDDGNNDNSDRDPSDDDFDPAVIKVLLCPEIGSFIEPANICEGEEVSLELTGLANMALAENCDQDYGIKFVTSGADGDAPADASEAYSLPTCLAEVTFAELTGSNPNRVASGLATGLTPGVYQICAVLTPQPGNPPNDDLDTCGPYLCIEVEVFDNPEVAPEGTTMCITPEMNTLDIDGNPSGGDGVYTHLWSITDDGGVLGVTLDNPDTETVTLNLSGVNTEEIFGKFTLNLSYQVTDGNGCASEITEMEIVVIIPQCGTFPWDGQE